MIMADKPKRGHGLTMVEITAQITELHALGFSRRQVVKRLKTSLTTVRKVFLELGGSKKQKTYTGNLHTWLDPQDEANTLRFWVPTPEEIAEQCEIFQARWTDAERQVRNMYK